MSEAEQTFCGHSVMQWDPSSPEQTREVLHWLEAMPRRDIVGFIKIRCGSPRIVSYRNRDTWENILRDIAREE
jgi:hypothetical protein